MALQSLEGLVRRARHDLVGAHAVALDVEHVAGDQRAHHVPGEGGVDLEPQLLAGGLANAAGHLEGEHPEAVEARVPKRLAVLGDVHAEPAGSTAAGGDEDVVVDDVLGGLALLRRAS